MLALKILYENQSKLSEDYIILMKLFESTSTRNFIKTEKLSLQKPTLAQETADVK